MGHIKNFEDYSMNENKKSLHTEFITVTRNEKTYTMRVHKKTPSIPSEFNTPIYSGVIDKLYFSYYFDGEFYDENGYKIFITPKMKDFAKSLKIRDFQKSYEDAWIHNLEITGDIKLTDKEISKIKKDIYKKERLHFNNKILPKIIQHKEFIDKWGKKNMTRLKNIYESIYKKENIIESINRETAKITKDSNYDMLLNLFKMIEFRLKDSVYENEISYKFNENEYIDKYIVFKKKIEDRLKNSSYTKYKQMGIYDFKILNLESIVPSERSKSWEQFYEEQKEIAEKRYYKK